MTKQMTIVVNGSLRVKKFLPDKAYTFMFFLCVFSMGSGKGVIQINILISP